MPGSLTPLQQEHLVQLALWVSFPKAVKLLAQLMGVQVSEATARRQTEEAGAAYEAVQNEQASQLLHEQENTSKKGRAKSCQPSQRAEPAPKLMLSSDGAMVPLVGGVWAEAKTVVIAEIQRKEKACKQRPEQQVEAVNLSYFSRLTDAETLAIHRDREPLHTDVMDLVGTANMQMVEAAPKALQADDPIAYLMTTAANAMSWHITYNDPLITWKRSRSITNDHPSTVRLEDWDEPAQEATPDNQDFSFVYNALGKLSQRHQIVLAAAYGLHGEAVRSNEDIAMMLHVSKETVEKYLWRAKRRLANILANEY